MALLGKVLPPEPPAQRVPTRITFNMGTKDIRPQEMKDVTPAADELPLPLSRLPAPDDE